MFTSARLERAELTVVDVEAQEMEKKLGEEAAEKLGYTAVMNVAGKARQIKRDEARLVSVLKKAGVTPFTAASVEAYKEKMQRKHTSAMREVYASWNTHALHYYNRVVPSFVLQTALAIKEVEPQVTFHVDEMSTRHEASLDPFLIVVLGTAQAYVEVWDEPEFNASRRV